MSQGSLLFPGYGPSGAGGSMSLAQQQLLGLHPERTAGQGQSNDAGRTSAATPSANAEATFSGDSRMDLELLGTEKLQELLTNEAEFKSFLSNWLKNTAAAKALEDIRQQNLTIAQENLNMQSAIDEARSHVAIVKSSDYATVKDEFDDLCRRQQAVLDKLNPSLLLQALRQESEKFEEESDQLVDNYEAGSLPIEQLVEQYVSKRVQAHIVDLKRQAAECSVHG